MTQTTQTNDLLARLPDPAQQSGPSWLAGLRQQATAHLREKGFPTKKDEAWKFTPVRPITSVPFVPTAGAREAPLDWVEQRLGQDGTWRLPLVNGSPRIDLAGEPPKGVEVRSLAEVLASDPESVESDLGKHASTKHFGALNAAMFEDGLVLRVDKNTRVDRPIHLVHVAVPGESPTAAYPRLLVQIEQGAEVSLVETFLLADGEKHLTNVVGEFVLGKNASVEHVRIQHGGDHGYHVATQAVHQDRDSRYASRVFTFGGGLFRLDLDVALDGENAECVLDGAYHTRGREHVDHHTVIDHRRPHCRSNEVYRGIVDGRSHAVFDGTIIVQRDSQHTEAHQENRNLLLSDDAGVNTKPHLRIDADDVKCSHGATTGALDEGQLHYLRARGIGREQATAMLTYAFVRELIDRVSHEPLRKQLSEAILARLPEGNSIRE